MREESSGAKEKRESTQRQLEEKKVDKSLECVKVQAVDADVRGITIYFTP